MIFLAIYYIGLFTSDFSPAVVFHGLVLFSSVSPSFEGLVIKVHTSESAEVVSEIEEAPLGLSEGWAITTLLWPLQSFMISRHQKRLGDRVQNGTRLLSFLQYIPFILHFAYFTPI